MEAMFILCQYAFVMSLSMFLQLLFYHVLLYYYVLLYYTKQEVGYVIIGIIIVCLNGPEPA